MVFSLHNCESWCNSQHPGSLGKPAILGSLSVRLKTEQCVHDASCVGGSATPLEGVQHQVQSLEGHAESAECEAVVVVDGHWLGKGNPLCRGLWRQQSKKIVALSLKDGYLVEESKSFHH